MILNETFTLTNGVKIPKLALGTWMIENDEVAGAVCAAVEIGYRHLDTAQGYFNERGVGEGVRMCGVPREELFVTTKIAAEHKTYESATASIDRSLTEAGLDYFDLVIIHSPQPWDKVNQSDYRYEKENVEVWRALEDALEAGKVRAIGLSNFLVADLENILANCRVRPMVNQVLCHVSATPFEIIDFCEKEGILVEAYSPVAHGALLGNEEVAAMAERYGVSLPQLCIRYTLQLGAVSLPKTANPDHMRSNAEVDFVISEADMASLKAVAPIETYGDADEFPVYGGKL